MRRPAVFVLALVVASAGVAACGSSSTTHAKVRSGGVVTIGINAEPTTINPFKVTTTIDKTVSFALYDSLVTLDSRTGKILPRLATSWRAVPNGVEVTVRDKATCANGEPLTAADVAASLRYYVDPAHKATNVVRNLGGGKIQVESSGAKVTITEAPRYADMLLGLATVPIVCPAGLKDPTTLDKRPSGSGPYTLDQVVPGNKYVLKARGDYSSGPERSTTGDSAAPSAIVLRIVPDPSTAANLLLSHQLNMSAVNPQDIARLKSSQGLQEVTDTGFGVYSLVMNETPSLPGADARIRSAVDQAINRDEVVAAATAGVGKVAPGILAPKADCFENESPSLIAASNPSAAKSVTAGRHIPLTIIGYPALGSAPELVAEQLENVGFTTKLVNTDFQTFINSLVNGKFDVAILPLEASSPSPNYIAPYLSGPAPPNGTNFPRINDDAATADAAEANQATGSERCDHWHSFQRSILTQHHALPLYQPPTVFFLHGVTAAVTGLYIDLSSVRVQG